MGIVHDLVIQPQTRPLSGSVPVPPDPHIAELALLTAALSEGTCELRKLGKTERIAGAMRALARLGVTIEHEGGDLARVHGASLLGLAPPNSPLLIGSPSTLRLLAGILVAYPFQTVLVGEGALASDHLASLVSPLRRRGAQIEGAFSKARVGEVIPPLVVGPLAPLQRLAELDHQFEVASPCVKDALVFSGLYADGPTYVRERLVSRDHLERLVQALEVPLATAGPILELDVERWEGKLPAFSCEVPGDFSAALVLLAAATLVPGSRVCARNTGLNLTRTGGLDLLRKWEPGIDVEVHAHRLGEPEGNACASHAELSATTMAGEVLARAIDDVPILAVLAARARGCSELGGLGELTEGDERLLQSIAPLLRAFGIDSAIEQGSLFVQGRPEGALGIG